VSVPTCRTPEHCPVRQQGNPGRGSDVLPEQNGVARYGLVDLIDDYRLPLLDDAAAELAVGNRNPDALATVRRQAASGHHDKLACQAVQ
jgi:hypothetical protein